MIAMEPVWRFLHNLEGFEFAAFWISFFTFLALVGFFLDYVMQRQGFGPLFNTVFVVGGIWAGLYLRYNYLAPNQVQLHLHDPYLSITIIFAVTVAMLVAFAFLRNKFS